VVVRGRAPEWTAEDDAAGRDWGPEVSSYAVDDGERLRLIDPTTPPAPILDLVADHETAIVLTGMRMPAQLFSVGDRLPFGVEAFPRREPPDDVLLWVESYSRGWAGASGGLPRDLCGMRRCPS
jgi:hypothetical protein